MATHMAAIPTQLDFGPWLGRGWRKVLALVSTIGISALVACVHEIAPLAKKAWPAAGAGLEQYAKVIPPGLTALVVLILVLVGWKCPHESKRLGRESFVADQFFRWWSAQWLAWLLFYLVLTIGAYLAGDRNDFSKSTIGILFSILSDALSNFQTAIFFVSYLILAEETVHDASGG